MGWIGQRTWPDQYLRMHRGLENVPRSVNRDDIATLYDAWTTFFIEVSNMRDWLEKDPATKCKCNKVKVEIRDKPEYEHIRMCVDLANQAKHLRGQPNEATILGAIHPGGINKSLSLSYLSDPRQATAPSTQDVPEEYTGLLIYDDKTSAEYDSWNAARKALQEWDQYLKDHSLTLPQLWIRDIINSS